MCCEFNIYCCYATVSIHQTYAKCFVFMSQTKSLSTIMIYAGLVLTNFLSSMEQQRTYLEAKTILVTIDFHCLSNSNIPSFVFQGRKNVMHLHCISVLFSSLNI